MGSTTERFHDLTFARLLDEYPAKLVRKVRLIVEACSVRGCREIAALNNLGYGKPHSGPRRITAIGNANRLLDVTLKVQLLAQPM